MPAILLKQVGRQRCEKKSSDARAADGNSGGQSPFLLEVVPDRYDGRQIDLRVNAKLVYNIAVDTLY